MDAAAMCCRAHRPLCFEPLSMAIYGRSEAAIDSLQRVKMEDQSVDGSHGRSE